MIELRFHRTLYPAAAVAGAGRTFAAHAAIEIVDDGAAHPDYVLLRLTAREPELEPRLALELANYALGLAIEATPGEER
jgi:hypothetical protein